MFLNVFIKVVVMVGLRPWILPLLVLLSNGIIPFPLLTWWWSLSVTLIKRPGTRNMSVTAHQYNLWCPYMFAASTLQLMCSADTREILSVTLAPASLLLVFCPHWLVLWVTWRWIEGVRTPPALCVTPSGYHPPFLAPVWRGCVTEPAWWLPSRTSPAAGDLCLRGRFPFHQPLS